jgi:hypothetical protein
VARLAVAKCGRPSGSIVMEALLEARRSCRTWRYRHSWSGVVAIGHHFTPKKEIRKSSMGLDAASVPRWSEREVISGAGLFPLAL